MNWTKIIEQVFLIVIIPLLGALTCRLIAFVNSKTADIKSKSKDDKINKYLEYLNDTICRCVIATNQTYVESLKKQGKFDADAQKIAFQTTYDSVMNILTEDAKKYLSEAVNDLNLYITSQIESRVAEFKINKI